MRPGLFSELELRSVTIPNRLMVSPMCQYSCWEQNGLANDWHRVHYGSRAVGGAGIVMTEASAVEPAGRITPWDLGIWSDQHAEALRWVAGFVADRGSVPAIQLAHAGRKASRNRPWEGREPMYPDAGGWEVISPSGIPYPEDEHEPRVTRTMDHDDIERVVENFVAAAERSVEAGFEILEIHAAHGYLLHQFLSPVANRREDEYGGDFEGRTRLLLEVVERVRTAIGEEVPLFVRISATDWLEDRDSWTVEQSIRLADDLAALGVDLIDVSSAGIHPDQDITYEGPNFQVGFAERIRNETESDVGVGAVGKITTPEQAEALIRNGRADLAILGRKLLADPYFPIRAAAALGESEALEPPVQYRRGF